MGLKHLAEDVPLREETRSTSQISVHLDSDGWHATIEYMLPEGPTRRQKLAGTFETPNSATAAAARWLVDRFGDALRVGRLSRASQVAVGLAITDLAAYRDQVEEQAAASTEKVAERAAGEVLSAVFGKGKDGKTMATKTQESGVRSQSDFEIDPDFEALSLAYSHEAHDLLSTSLEIDGCRDPLLVWRDPETGRLILIDGHRRLAICRRQGLEFDTREIDFLDRAAALSSCRDQQLARRNLTEEQKSYLRGKRYLAEKKQVGRQKNNGDSVSPLSEVSDQQSVVSGQTAERIAKSSGVSARTVKRDAKFAAAVDKVAEAAPEAKALAVGGKLAKAEVASLAALPPEEIRQAAKHGKAGLQEAAQKTAAAAAKKSLKKAAKSSLQSLAEVAGYSSPAKAPYEDLQHATRVDEWLREWFRVLAIKALSEANRPPPEALRACVAALEVDFSLAWNQLQCTNVGLAGIKRFFELHSAADIRSLAHGMGVWTGGTDTKAAVLQKLLTVMNIRRLPPPKSLQPITRKASAAKSGGPKAKPAKKARAK